MFLTFFFFFLETRSHCVAQAGLQLMSSSDPFHLKNIWDKKYVPLHPALDYSFCVCVGRGRVGCVVLVFELRALHLLGGCSTA
jgi:hypothetical protein